MTIRFVTDPCLPFPLDLEPECGDDFCETCGDCISCYGGDPCLMSGESSDEPHVWYIDLRPLLTDDEWERVAGAEGEAEIEEARGLIVERVTEDRHERRYGKAGDG